MRIIKNKPDTTPKLIITKGKDEQREIATIAEQLTKALQPRDGVDGIDGRNIELSKTENSIQWRYIGQDHWETLVELNELKGKDGVDGIDGKHGNAGATGATGKPGRDGKDGKNGTDGDDGKDGEEVLLRTNSEFVQWKHENDKKWKNLIALNDLRGPRGYPGTSWGSGIGEGGTTGGGNAETGDTLPPSGSEGELFFDTVTGILWIWTGGMWVQLTEGYVDGVYLTENDNPIVTEDDNYLAYN